MRRVVIDTNLYIDWFNAGQHENVVFQTDAVKYMSAIVMMELYAGAFSAHDRSLIRKTMAVFEKTSRIIIPSVTTYADSGNVLRELKRSRVSNIRSLVNDVLIALSARQIGATVITKNKRDFIYIQRIRHFKLAVVA